MLAQAWGQHFLVNRQVADFMVDQAQLGQEDMVLEVGPGKGILTERIAPRVKRLVCVEIDRVLARKLEAALSSGSVVVVQDDILEIGLSKLFPKNQKVKILSNIPYGITAPLLVKFMAWPGWSEAWMMVQKEVARRLAARPGIKDYGILSIAVQLWSDVRILKDISPGSFKPRPKVNSSIVYLKRLGQPRVAVGNEEDFFRVVKAAFGQRRKTLINSLSHRLGIEKDQVAGFLRERGIDGSRRAETLTLEEFAHLADIMKRV